MVKRIPIFFSVLLLFLNCQRNKIPTTYSATPNPLVDQDGNIYQTVRIGNQVWIAENLRVTHYRNGDPISIVTDSIEWANLMIGAYCTYDNDESNAEIYGCLYNWYAVNDSRQISPEGWHVPTDEDWKELELSLGMHPSELEMYNWRGTDEGGKLKEAGMDHWLTPNIGATNSSGFCALPAGYRIPYDGMFDNFSTYTNLWTSTEIDSTLVYTRSLGYDYSKIFRSVYFHKAGLTVRLIRNKISSY